MSGGEQVSKEREKPINKSDEPKRNKKYSFHKSFYIKLEEHPEIIDFIEHLQRVIEVQKKKIRKIKSKLKNLTQVPKNDASIQTEDNTLIDGKTENTKPKTIAEEITEAAESALKQTGFVYEETSGLYYDYSSGYYYNAELGLYYDGNTGTYLKYNQEKNEYEYHSQVQISQDSESITKKKRKRKTKLKKENVQSNVDGSGKDKEKMPLEEGECSDSESSISEESVTDSEDSETDASKQYPPCMRLMVQDGGGPRLRKGSLFLVTCDGGTVGREGDHAVLLPDVNVSKAHASIVFDTSAGKYFVKDLGSRNGTILNGQRMSESKEQSQPQEVMHGSTLVVGGVRLVCHIHPGQSTCGHCEPGLVQGLVAEQDAVAAESESKKDRIPIEKQHKKELNRLKKKFGLEGVDYMNTALATGYMDRAQTRRKEVGGTDHSEKTEMTSLDTSISSGNKGFKLLSKMGWSEGQGLGKANDGVKEPVPLVQNQGTTGLGAVISAPPIISEKRLKQIEKMQQRFQKTM